VGGRGRALHRRHRDRARGARGGRHRRGRHVHRLTNGDNTNLVVAQIAQKRYGVGRVLVRVLDPARSDWYAKQGLETICGTQFTISQFERALGVG
jgi:hypothetical protein